jgi:hypothetical protein
LTCALHHGLSRLSGALHNTFTDLLSALDRALHSALHWSVRGLRRRWQCHCGERSCCEEKHAHRHRLSSDIEFPSAGRESVPKLINTATIAVFKDVCIM